METRTPALALCFVCLLASPAAADPAADAAGAFLAALGDERSRASWRFDDDERFDVHYAPLRLDGIELGELEGEARGHAEALLAATLSERGLETVTALRELERDVIEHERGSLFGWTFRSIRDPERYLFAVFGEPSASEPWALRFEGHHLSLNVTHRPGAPAATTPLFIGAQPRVAPEGFPSAGVALLGEEETLARRLFAALDPEQQARARLRFEDGRDWMLGQRSRVDPPAAVGLPRGEMTGPQQDLLDAIIARFAALWPAEEELARHAELDAAGRDAIHFAWTESDDPPDAFYLRISGPRILLEIDNTTDGEHVHAVWHDPGADFGTDLLAEHYLRSHELAISR